ncbi:MAG: feoB [Francisellaceae bacterium]|nr:feoB [Francisellaceae bacterium]
MSLIALLGNPNSGKTTIFNALTKSSQKVGNWAGVTVEEKKAYFWINKKKIELIDLPGTYSLIGTLNEGGIDEQKTHRFLLNNKADLIINVIDANQLERQLYLTLQLREQGFKVIVAINMMDLALSQGRNLNCKQLAENLQCPVIPLVAHQSPAFSELTLQIEKSLKESYLPYFLPYPPLLLELLKQEDFKDIEHQRDIFLKFLEGDELSLEKIKNNQKQLKLFTEKYLTLVKLYGPLDELIATLRYKEVDRILHATITQITPKKGRNIKEKLDNVLVHKWLGIPSFLAIMYLMFLLSINLGQYFQEHLEPILEWVFSEKLTYLFSYFHLPHVLKHILIEGLGIGLQSVLSFVPVMTLMFFSLSFLESSGYMARAAFVMDRLMQYLGLPGKSFVPLVIGFGCNVPAVMGARTLENQKERMLTILMSPFISCGARLTIYALFAAAFFPKSGHNIIFALYLLGILMAILTGLLLRKTILIGPSSTLTLELPQYHWPRFKLLLRHTYFQLKSFVIKAGTIIIPVCLFISLCNQVDSTNRLEKVGKFITPIFSPMGIEADNWQASIGLLTGLMAKEVVVGTLNGLYDQELKNNPLNDSSPETLHPSIFGVMSLKFKGSVGAFAYLIFILLYFPCISVIAVIAKELSKRWALFTMGWSTLLAYSCAVIFYQIATFNAHPIQSGSWILGLPLIWIIIWGALKNLMDKKFKRLSLYKPIPGKININNE